MTKKLVTEFIGTFFLVLTVGLTVVGGSPLAPLAIGSALMVMVYMGGHVSGGHFNPAVSLAVYLRGKLDRKELVPYWVAQLLGAVVAAHLTAWIMGAPLVVMPSETHPLIHSLAIEFLFTFALALVVLHSATTTATAGNSFYGLAIGFTVTVGAFAGGSISGGAFNPAVGLGPAITNVVADSAGFGAAWIYIVAPLLGGWAAAAVYRMQSRE